MARQEAVYGEIGDYLTKFRGGEAVSAAEQIVGLLSRRPVVSQIASTAGQLGGSGFGLLGHLLTTQSQRRTGLKAPQ